MNFDARHFYRHSEMLDLLQEWVKQRPDLIQLVTIDKSYEGRDIPVAVLTNQTTGNVLDKPGYWIDRNTHAAEVTGFTVCLYPIADLIYKETFDPFLPLITAGILYLLLIFAITCSIALIESRFFRYPLL